MNRRGKDRNAVTDATHFTTEDVRNIVLLAGDCLRSRKIGVRTANRINKAAERAIRALRANLRTTQEDTAKHGNTRYRRRSPSYAKPRRYSHASRKTLHMVLGDDRRHELVGVVGRSRARSREREHVSKVFGETIAAIE